MIIKKIKNKKGISLIEAILAIVILVFPIFATISTITFLKTQIHRRNLELLAENLINYILEDLRGRRFYGSEGNKQNNLELLYLNLPNEREVQDPFGSFGVKKMRYSSIVDYELYDTFIYLPNVNEDETFNRYVELPSEEARKFYNIFQVELYITRYINSNNPEDLFDPYKNIYKIDVVLLIEDPKSSYTTIDNVTVQGWKRFTVASTEVAFHEP